MQRNRLTFRLTAVVSSVSLMAAFVAYRAGALDSLIPGRSNARQREMLSGSKSQINILMPNGPAAALPGSKSGVVAAPSPVLATEISPEGPPVVTPRVLISSSKSAVLVQEPFSTLVGEAFEEALPQPSSEPFQKVKVGPEMMSGSKNITIVPSSALSGDANLEP